VSRATPEETLERDLIRLLESLGVVVVKFSQGARGRWDPNAIRKDGTAGKFIGDRGGTRQTRGPSDLELWVQQGERLTLCKFEVKTPAGLRDHHRFRVMSMQEMVARCPSRKDEWQRAQDQARYGAMCQVAGIPYGIGGQAELLVLLERLGLVQQRQQGLNAPLLVRASGNAFERVTEIAGRG